MRSLQGGIHIGISVSDAEKEEENDSEGGYLANLDQLNSICIEFPNGIRIEFPDSEEQNERHEGLLGKLQPHPNVRRLELKNYNGGEIGRWGTPKHNWASILPNLVHIRVYECKWLRHLPVLSRLQHLKTLELCCLNNVEYMEETEGDSASFFPSLEYLYIFAMKKLKGWWRRRAGSNDDICPPPPFTCLSKLTIYRCPNLLSLPDCPTVETLKLEDVNERMRLSSTTPSVKSLSGQEEEVFNTSIFSSLQSLVIRFCGELKSLPRGMQYLASLQHLSIEYCGNIEGIPEWISCLSSLQSLSINYCEKIKSMPEAMRNITSLHRLEIYRCSKELNERCQDPDGEDWPKIKHIPNISIRSW